ncbi:MAG TPA: VWA domain-containing protein [Pyrinomonadaceae bacterium]|jgi:Ca-activated chloride channel family protein|nr:VWA domain-containing protein [Pyrinomonadaceae bacterium]
MILCLATPRTRPQRLYASALPKSRSALFSRSAFFLHASLLLLLLAYAPCARVSAQEDAASADEADVLRVRTDLLTVPFFVTDKGGRRVGGLTAADFTVRDDGHPVKVEYFAAGTERVALLFALDSSGSARDILTHQRETALALFSRFGRGSRVAVLRFADKSELVVPLTTDARQPLAGFSSPAMPGRHTAIFDAAAAALRAFDNRGSDPSERRIVILFSDGMDTVSTWKAEAVIREARAAAVSIYVIHLLAFAVSDGRLVPRPASKGFRELAERTGGAYFRIGDARSALDPRAEYDLKPIFRAIEEDLRAQYILGYYPGEGARDGRSHRIEIIPASRNRGLQVRSLRESYNLKQ